AEHRGKPGPVIALLPGSRRGELKYSRHALARAAAMIHERRPDVRFLVACLKPEHAGELRPFFGPLRLPLEVCHGKTPAIVHLAHSCLSVSGSVSLELLYRGKPSVMFYHMHPLTIWIAQRSFKLNSVTLVNLLAKRPLFPEYVCPTSGRTILTSPERI